MGMQGMGMPGMGMPGMGPGGMPDPSKMPSKQRAMFEKVQRASPKEREALMKQMEEMMSNFGEGGSGPQSRGESSMGSFMSDMGGDGAEADNMETVDLDGPQVISGGTSD